MSNAKVSYFWVDKFGVLVFGTPNKTHLKINDADPDPVGTVKAAKDSFFGKHAQSESVVKAKAAASRLLARIKHGKYVQVSVTSK